METFTLKIPALFGDHHTTEVQRLLGQLEGVQRFIVSSGFNEVWVEIDPKALERSAVEEHLRRSGYASGDQEPVYPSEHTPNTTKHTELESDVIAFYDAQPTWEGRPLWPCPGLAYQPAMDEE